MAEQALSKLRHEAARVAALLAAAAEALEDAMAGEDEGALEAAEAAASAAGVGAPLLEAAAARRGEIRETLQLRAEEEALARLVGATERRDAEALQAALDGEVAALRLEGAPSPNPNPNP